MVSRHLSFAKMQISIAMHGCMGILPDIFMKIINSCDQNYISGYISRPHVGTFKPPYKLHTRHGQPTVQACTCHIWTMLRTYRGGVVCGRPPLLCCSKWSTYALYMPVLGLKNYMFRSFVSDHSEETRSECFGTTARHQRAKRKLCW